MTERRQQIIANLAAYALLFSVSLYRQLSLRLLPDDPARTYVLYACYVVLLLVWGLSLRRRIAQRGMLTFLLFEAAFMGVGATIRFLQDTFWVADVALMRESGLVLVACLLPTLLLGFYASLGLGRPDTYRICRGWYLLAAPLAAVAVLLATDDRRHLFFSVVAGEPQPNLEFHPYLGVPLLFVMAAALVAARVIVLYRRNGVLRSRPFLRRFVPLFEPAALLLVSAPSLLVWSGAAPWLAGWEVLELYARLYYVEVISWELYLYLGLVPVNIGYREAFEYSTLAMRILTDDGREIISQDAGPLDRTLLTNLGEGEGLLVAPGRELHVHRLPGALFAWEEDVTAIQQTIEALGRDAEALAEEGALLQEEMRARNRQARLLARNRIYDEVAGEVLGQLKTMRCLLARHAQGDDDPSLLARLCELGTYVKRRSNLRLTQMETGELPMEDVRLSLEDMVRALRRGGTQARLTWACEKGLKAQNALFAMDQLQLFLEGEDFEVAFLEVEVDDARATIRFVGSQTPSEAKVAHEAPVQVANDRATSDNGYDVVVYREGRAPCSQG